MDHTENAVGKLMSVLIMLDPRRFNASGLRSVQHPDLRASGASRPSGAKYGVTCVECGPDHENAYRDNGAASVFGSSILVSFGLYRDGLTSVCCAIRAFMTMSNVVGFARQPWRARRAFNVWGRALTSSWGKPAQDVIRPSAAHGFRRRFMVASTFLTISAGCNLLNVLVISSDSA